jgi:hypothetical protein
LRLRLLPTAALAALILGGWCSPADAAQSGPLCGGPISIPSPGYGVPYPSNCEIEGRAGTITDVDFRIQDLTHTWPDDLDMLLVGPGGENAVVMSDAGGSLDVSGVDFTLDDAADEPLPNAAQIQNRAYRPANYDGFLDPFGPKAPPPSGATELAVFNGTDPTERGGSSSSTTEGSTRGTFWTGARRSRPRPVLRHRRHLRRLHHLRRHRPRRRHLRHLLRRRLRAAAFHVCSACDLGRPGSGFAAATAR